MQIAVYLGKCNTGCYCVVEISESWRGGGHDEAYFLDREGDPQTSLVGSQFTRDLKAFIGVAFVIIGVLDR